MKFKEEIDEIPPLKNIGLALFQFADDLFPNNDFEQDSHDRWVPRPNNFVTIKVQPRAKNLAVTLRGNPGEFLNHDELPLSQDQNGYSIFRISKPSQLKAAADYVSRAAELFRRGRMRIKKQPVVTERQI